MDKFILFSIFFGLAIPVKAQDKIDYNYINCINFEVTHYTHLTAPALCYSSLFPGEIACLPHLKGVDCVGEGVNYTLIRRQDHIWDVFDQQRDELVAVIYYNFLNENPHTIQYFIEYGYVDYYSTCTYLGEIVTLCGL